MTMNRNEEGYTAFSLSESNLLPTVCIGIGYAESKNVTKAFFFKFMCSCTQILKAFILEIKKWE